MSEYIVDVGNAVEEYIEHFDHMATTYADNPIRELIVRCRDCVHMLSIDLSDYYGNPEPRLEVCKRVRGVHLDAKPDGFCAWGERREQ